MNTKKLQSNSKPTDQNKKVAAVMDSLQCHHLVLLQKLAAGSHEPELVCYTDLKELIFLSFLLAANIFAEEKLYKPLNDN